MPKVKGKKVFLVGNCCAFTGDTGMFWKDIMQKKGYDVFYVNHLIMPTNFNLPYEPENHIKRVPVGEELQKILAAAEEKITQVCTSILNGERKDDGTGLSDKIGGALQRETYWMADGYKHHFSVVEERCIKCGQCRRVCPSENVTIDGEKKVHFGNKCMMCVKCYNLCPVDAILICKASIDNEKYRRYKGPSKHIRPVTYRK